MTIRHAYLTKSRVSFPKFTGKIDVPDPPKPTADGWLQQRWAGWPVDVENTMQAFHHIISNHKRQLFIHWCCVFKSWILNAQRAHWPHTSISAKCRLCQSGHETFAHLTRECRFVAEDIAKWKRATSATHDMYYWGLGAPCQPPALDCSGVAAA